MSASAEACQLGLDAFVLYEPFRVGSHLLPPRPEICSADETHFESLPAQIRDFEGSARTTLDRVDQQTFNLRYRLFVCAFIPIRLGQSTRCTVRLGLLAKHEMLECAQDEEDGEDGELDGESL